jgi:stress response protein YsnF
LKGDDGCHDFGREGETLRVPVVKEELKVEKVPRVTEEVVLRTETQTRQVQQDVQLRRERVNVQEEGDAEVETSGDAETRKA